MRGFRARLVSLIAALTLLVPASALADVVYYCKMSGSVGPRCCCARAKDSRAEPTCNPAVDRPDCCEAQVQAGRDGVVAGGERGPSVGPATLATVLTVSELVERARALCVLAEPQARGPPGIGPPIFLKNCSLLH